MSTENEYPKPLSATVKGSFAYYTIKDRLPVTITKSIDNISRFRNELIKRYPEEATIEDTKSSIEKLSQLRYELVTDKQLRKMNDSGNDLEQWNKSIDELEATIGADNCTWFKAPWLYTECYVYRRIREAMLTCTSGLRDYDPFENSKLETHQQNEKSVFQLVAVTCPLDAAELEKNDNALLRRRFNLIMEALLWANKNDLSLSSGQDVSHKVNNLADLLDSLQSNILCDESEHLWHLLERLRDDRRSGRGGEHRIDIVLDNCSIELTADLIFCDFLLRNEFVAAITLHAKAFSWFISDVTKYEFEFQLRQLESSNSLVVANLVKRLRAYLADGRLRFEHEHTFWTLPYSYDRMPELAPDLYRHFVDSSSLVVFKGDLNYRKLIGDLDWPFDAKLKMAARDFQPGSVCAIRTIKADLIAGLDLTSSKYLDVLEKYKGSRQWMNTGDYGIIQFYS